MKIKILLISSLILSTLLPYKVSAVDRIECSTFSSKDSYELYKQRSKCICDQYKSSTNMVTIRDDYPKIVSADEIAKITKPFEIQLVAANKKEQNEKTKEQIAQIERNLSKALDSITNKYSLDETKYIHRDNMNTIYKCGLLSTQKKSLLLIKNDLIKKSPSIWKKIEGKIDANISKLDSISNTLDCTKSKSKSSVQKLTLLRQATYQTCKYVSYLEYLKEHNRDTRNHFDPKKTRYTPTEIANIESEKIIELEEEIEHTYKVFPLVFHAYTEYENNITAHFLLELLQDDYLTLREKLHEALNPINQVVYKIVNAMKK